MNRKTWKYKDCTIKPMKGPATYFGCANFKPDSRCPQYFTRWWKVIFPDKSWLTCPTKQSARNYIDSWRE